MSSCGAFVEKTEGGSSDDNNMYCLKWKHYQTSMTSGFAELLEDKEYSMTDVTLACEGKFVQAHKLALVVSSPFFKDFFKVNRVEKAGITLIALANVKFKDIKNILHFIYHGEVNVNRSDLNSFLQTGNLLKIKGLGEFSETEPTTQSNSNEMQKFEYSSSNLNVATKAPFCGTSATSTKRVLQTQSLRTPPLVLHEEQSCRLPTSAVHISSNLQTAKPANTTLSSSSLITDFHNENDEVDEEMIDLDNVKSEPISVYSVVDSEDSEEDDGGGGFTAGDITNDEDNSINFEQHSGSFVHYESQMGQTPAPVLESGPSASTLSPFSHLPKNHHKRRSRTADGEHGIGNEYYDNSENPTLYFLCLCGTKFRSQQSLKRHIREAKAAKSGTLICPVCGVVFSRERSLKAHLKEGKCRRLIGSNDQTIG